MSAPILIAGAGMTGFSRASGRTSSRVLVEQAVRAALADAGLDYDLVDRVVVSHGPATLWAGREAMQGFAAAAVPVADVSAGFVSGSTAFQLARQAVLSGEAECALAVGVDTGLAPTGGWLPSYLASALSPVAQRYGLNGLNGQHGLDGLLALERCWLAEHWGLGVDDRRLILARALDGTPARDPGIGEDRADEPVWSAGAAAVLVCSAKFAARYGVRQGIAVLATLTVEDFDAQAAVPDLFGRRAIARAVSRALELAALGPEELDLIELFDVSAEQAVVACSAALTLEPDQAVRLLAGTLGRSGHPVIAPSGGMLARGFAPGANGLAQLVELCRQLRGQAPRHPVDGAQTALQQEGGPGGAVAVTVLGLRR